MFFCHTGLLHYLNCVISFDNEQRFADVFERNVLKKKECILLVCDKQRVPDVTFCLIVCEATQR